MNRRDFGDQGERLAADFLRRKRYRILETNYSRPTGEIDIIARQGKTLVFVEVKRRSSLRYGRPSQAVDRGKQAHILRTAALYLKGKPAVGDPPHRKRLRRLGPEKAIGPDPFSRQGTIPHCVRDNNGTALRKRGRT